MISMFAMVLMNGCILNRAVKKPAIDVKITQKRMVRTSARIAQPASGMPDRSKAFPNTVPVFGPLCMIIVQVTMPIPIIRPIERSVPVSRISPATPSARNIRGDACCRMFRMLVAVNSCVCLTAGVIKPSAMKTATMTIYSPFLRKNCFQEKE